MDDYFNSAYQRFEEEPSSDVWKKLSAGLDKKEAESYKRRFAGWMRFAIILLLLLAGFILYESGIFKKGNILPDKNLVTKKSVIPSAPPDGNVARDEKADLSDVAKNAEKKKRLISKSQLSIINQKSRGNNSRMDRLMNKATNKSIQPDKGNNSDIFVKGSEMPVENKNRIAIVDKMVSPLINPGSQFIQKPLLPYVSNQLTTEQLPKQEQIKKPNPFKPYWAGTFIASYEHADYRLDSELPTARDIKQREIHEPSFSTGVLLTRQLKEQLGLQTGLIFTNTAIAITPQKIYAIQDPDGNIAYKYVTSSGYAYIRPGFGPPPAFGDSLTAAEAKHTLQSIAIPLVIKYTAGRNKFSFVPGVGLEANFLTSAKVETEIEDTFNKEFVFINKLNGAKSFYLSFTADAELRYNLNKKSSLSLRPTFRYALSPITENNVAETFPYSFGLGIGVTHKF